MRNDSPLSARWWKSILDEKGADGLDLSASEIKQTETKLQEADDSIRQRIRETIQHVITPKHQPGKAEVTWQTTRTAGNGDLAEKTAKKLESSEELITSYGGIRMRMDLDRPEADLCERRDSRHSFIKSWRRFTA